MENLIHQRKKKKNVCTAVFAEPFLRANTHWSKQTPPQIPVKFKSWLLISALAGKASVQQALPL